MMLTLISEVFVSGCCCVCVFAAYAFVFYQVYEGVRACIKYGWRNAYIDKAMLFLTIAALVFCLFGGWYLTVGWNVTIG